MTDFWQTLEMVDEKFSPYIDKFKYFHHVRSIFAKHGSGGQTSYNYLENVIHYRDRIYQGVYFCLISISDLESTYTEDTSTKSLFLVLTLENEIEAILRNAVAFMDSLTRFITFPATANVMNYQLNGLGKKKYYSDLVEWFSNENTNHSQSDKDLIRKNLIFDALLAFGKWERNISRIRNDQIHEGDHVLAEQDDQSKIIIHTNWNSRKRRDLSKEFPSEIYYKDGGTYLGEKYVLPKRLLVYLVAPIVALSEICGGFIESAINRDLGQVTCEGSIYQSISELFILNKDLLNRSIFL